MLAGWKTQIGRRANLGQDDVGGFVGSVRNFLVQSVGDRFQDALDFAVQLVGFPFQPFHLATDRGGLGFQFGGDGAGPLAFANLPGQQVPPRLLFLQRGVGLSARAITRQDIRRHRRQTATDHRGVECRGVSTDGADIMHRVRPPRVWERQVWRQ